MLEAIANQSEDEPHWKLQRRRHITGSDVFKFLPLDVFMERGWWMEQWMARDSEGNDASLAWLRRDIFDRKLTGRELEFSNPTQVEWGRREEDHLRDRFAKYSGLEVGKDHTLYRNPRWPYIATSLDAWVMRRHHWRGLAEPIMFVKPEQVEEAANALPLDEAVLLEMKTTSDYGVTAWLNGKRNQPRSKIIAGRFTPQAPGVPIYYLPQVLTQMSICGITHNLVVCHGGMSNMTAHCVQYDPTWDEVLDIVNAEVRDNIEDIRSVLDAKE